MADFESVLSFWFGELDSEGRVDKEHTARWWKKDSAFDRTIVDEFGALHAEVARGVHDAWLESPRGRLAYIIVLDQFSRNMFRGTGKSFAFDPRAVEVVLEGLERGVDRELSDAERGFFYMPLMHSENLAHQDRCVEAFSTWRDEASSSARERVAGQLDFAERHRAIVRRFGRFPHRNALVGRESTPEEVEFLKQPGSSF
jgi:uncharacterized protein (DUF924 family)